MKTISLQLPVSDRTPEQVFADLRNFASYPRLCPAVRSVELLSEQGDTAVSSWVVNFQTGVLKWTERDYFDAAKREISFEQLTGDIEHFSGLWRVLPARDGSLIHFDARFDLGIPMLADMLDPVAQKAIEQNIRAIVQGLFGSPAWQVAA